MHTGKIPDGMFSIDKKLVGDTEFSVVGYKRLKGSDDLNVAEKVFFANEANINLKFIKIDLNDSSIVIEPGALYFMKGKLSLESNIEGGIVSGLFRKATSGETLFQSTISGTGEVFLEPSFGHFLLLDIDDDELIMDDGSFYCCSKGIKVSGAIQKNISSALFGGETLVQTSTKGTGLVVINSPVPESELICYELESGEKLRVDGNFALIRTASVKFSVEKSGKSLFQSLTSGEGLLQTFEGPGIVWIAPTQVVYNKIKRAGVNGLANSAKSGNMNNSV